MKGLSEQLAAFRVFSDKTTFDRFLLVPMQYAMEKEVVPAIKTATPPTRYPNRPNGDYAYWGKASGAGVPHGPYRPGIDRVQGGRVKQGRRGPLRKTVTVKRAKKNSARAPKGEAVALNVGPRAWYRHFKIAGVKGRHAGVDYVGETGRRVPKDRIMQRMIAVPIAEYHRRLGRKVTP